MVQIDPWLERAYWISQVLLLLVAFITAIAAFSQLRTFKLFELLKYTQSDNFRRARRIVIREIEPQRDEQWWETNDVLEEAGSAVCGAYDVLGHILEFDGNSAVASFFITNWARSIIRTYNALSPFMENRRDAGGTPYLGYTWLYNKAKKLSYLS